MIKTITPKTVERLEKKLAQEVANYNDNGLNQVFDLFNIRESHAKLPETTIDFLQQTDKIIYDKFCLIVLTLQNKKYSECLRSKKFKDEFGDKNNASDFSLQDVLRMVQLCKEGREVILRRIALLLYNDCSVSSILDYCEQYVFYDEKKAKEKLKKERKIKKENAPLAESELKIILTYSYYSQPKYSIVKCVARLHEKKLLSDFCCILFGLQYKKTNEKIFDWDSYIKFRDEKGKEYPPIYHEEDIEWTDSNNVKHIEHEKQICDYDFSRIWFDNAECDTLLRMLNPSSEYIRAIAVLLLARQEKEYFPQVRIEWSHITWEHILDYYSTKNPLIIVEADSYMRNSAFNWIYPRLKPLDEKAVRKLVKRYETYDKKTKEMRVAQISTLSKEWDASNKQKFSNAITYLPYNDAREIAILVNEGYSVEEICDYYNKYINA